MKSLYPSRRATGMPSNENSWIWNCWSTANRGWTSGIMSQALFESYGAYYGLVSRRALAQDRGGGRAAILDRITSPHNCPGANARRLTCLMLTGANARRLTCLMLTGANARPLTCLMLTGANARPLACLML